VAAHNALRRSSVVFHHLPRTPRQFDPKARGSPCSRPFRAQKVRARGGVELCAIQRRAPTPDP
jgi:hypothetical protein